MRLRLGLPARPEMTLVIENDSILLPQARRKKCNYLTLHEQMGGGPLKNKMQMALLCIGKVVVGVNCKTEMASIPTKKRNWLKNKNAGQTGCFVSKPEVAKHHVVVCSVQ